MYNSLIRNKFNEFCNRDGLLSSAGAERLLKSLGFNTSRKNINMLLRKGLITSYETKTGITSNGNRIKYSGKDVMELATYLLADAICGLHGPISRDKARMFAFAKDAIAEYQDGNDFMLYAKLRSLSASSYFISDNIHGEKRIKEQQRVGKCIKAVMCSLWMADKILSSNATDGTIEDSWNQFRKIAFSDSAARKFAFRLMDGQSEADVTKIKLLAESLSADAKEALKAWVEIIMAYGPEIMLIKEQAVDYMLKKFGISLTVELSPINLFALSVCLR